MLLCRRLQAHTCHRVPQQLARHAGALTWPRLTQHADPLALMSPPPRFEFIPLTAIQQTQYTMSLCLRQGHTVHV